MTRFLSDDQARAYSEADNADLVPAGSYRVKVISIDTKDTKPDIKCFKMKVVSGPFSGRTLRAWVNTAANMIWTVKKLVGDVVLDPAKLQYEDLEGHSFQAEVIKQRREDNGELANRVLKLSPLADSSEGKEAFAAEDPDIPF